MKLHGSKEIAARGGVGIEGEDGCLEVYSEDENELIGRAKMRQSACGVHRRSSRDYRGCMHNKE